MFHWRYDHQTKIEFGLIGELCPLINIRDVPSQAHLCGFGVFVWLLTYQAGQPSTGSNQAYRTISTSQLNVLPRLHLWPIDEVVYLGPQGYLVLRGASRLDAFSGYPVRT